MPPFDSTSAINTGIQTTSLGAGIGTAILPGLGTAVGAGIGSIVGLGLGLFDYFRSRGDDPQEAARKAHQFDSTFVATPEILARTDFSQAMTDAQAQQAIAFAQAQATQAQQADLATVLREQAAGRGGPSVAEAQLRQATNRIGEQAAGAAAAARGINPGLAARLGGQFRARASADAAGQAAVLRAQEQAQARAQLGQLLAAQRGQSLEQQGASTSLYGIGAQGTTAQRGQDYQALLEAQRLNAQVAAGNADRAAGVSGQTQANQNVANARADQQTVRLAQMADAAAAAATMGGGGTTATTDTEPPAVGPRPYGWSTGGRVPGRAPVRGDSPANDKVRAMLSPGEIVLPRSIVDHPDAPERAAAFVEALLRLRSGGKRPAAGAWGR